MTEIHLGSNTELCHEARRIIEAEMMALAILRLDRAFPQAVRLLAACRGKVVTTGVGKSGIVAQRIAATLTVTGTPAWFLHPVEASHGNIGAVQGKLDLFLFVSKSGETDELLGPLAYAKRWGMPLIIITSQPHSLFARQADCVLVHSEAEACEHGLTPTSTATAASVLGDCLALVLQKYRGFGPSQFAALHYGGSLGRELKLRAQRQVAPLLGSDLYPAVEANRNGDG